jgi:hypothetical protein
VLKCHLGSWTGSPGAPQTPLREQGNQPSNGRLPLRSLDRLHAALARAALQDLFVICRRSSAFAEAATPSTTVRPFGFWAPGGSMRWALHRTAPYIGSCCWPRAGTCARRRATGAGGSAFASRIAAPSLSYSRASSPGTRRRGSASSTSSTTIAPRLAANSRAHSCSSSGERRKKAGLPCSTARRACSRTPDVLDASMTIEALPEPARDGVAHRERRTL